jgi:hypothetical protein
MNDDPRIKLLMDSVAKLNDILGGLIKKSEEERQARVEMCMTLWGFVVRVTNQYATMARRFADFPAAFADDDSKRIFLDEVTRIEIECEHFEHIFAKEKGLGNEQSSDDPATPGPA